MMDIENRMIIDSHAHLAMPSELYQYMGELVASRANPAAPFNGLAKEVIEAVAARLIGVMDGVGTDVQFLSPRPYMMLHSLRPALVGSLWTRAVNDVIHAKCQLFPKRFRGVAGLPQYRSETPQNCLAELERCVRELGFVGCLLNPDPTEGEEQAPPGLGDRFWYPLYEKLVELDVPALIHSSSSCDPRESYTLKFINEESIAVISLLDSTVFQDFPTLKLVISHGGGAIPYQMGRFRAWAVRRRQKEFDEQIRRLYFDTCNYSPEALEFQLRILGVDNCLFGTERPGTGTILCHQTGRDFDDLRPAIESIGWLTAEDKQKIFEGNCRKVYSRAFPS
jgi:4-oxalmesaconate hydratase